MALRSKQVAGRLYLNVDQFAQLDRDAAQTVTRAEELARTRGELTYNVLRLDYRLSEVAFLHYPTLGLEPFPSLKASWRVHLPSQLVTYRRYENSLNPPILHRTELLLATDHPAHSSLGALTAACESIGLFANTAIIGFQRQWAELVGKKGYEIFGFELVPIANDLQALTTASSSSSLSEGVARHLTALTRHSLSAPVQSMMRDELLIETSTFFDYGCGKGDDLATLHSLGRQGEGWDPHYRRDAQRFAAKVVNIGFVINVIEDYTERVQALKEAYALATQLLTVAAMVTNADHSPSQRYADGILTTRHTFQKYYTQAELQQFIESVLEEDAYPAAPGVFYVFRDRTLEQTYLRRKSSNRAHAPKPRPTTAPHERLSRTSSASTTIPSPPISPEELACLRNLWDEALELGRFPEDDELSNLAEIKHYFRSSNRAQTACLAITNTDELTRVAVERRNDILVMLALRFFERRRKITQLESRLRTDIRVFFGSRRAAEEAARDLLFSLNSTEKISAACVDASAQGLGWLESGKSLQLHTSMANALPAILRVYIGCATALAGSVTVWDLVKLHIGSGKVTLLLFDGFAEKPLPSLLRRLKVRLKDQDIDIFDHGTTQPPSLLYNKSRYINEEFPRYTEQLEFDRQMNKMRSVDMTGYGPTPSELYQSLKARRYEIVDFELRRSSSVPGLDEKCGDTFTFRDLIQCGETCKTLGIDNQPLSFATYNALRDLAANVLDPVTEYFGVIKLTYGFASSSLTKHIKSRIAPKLDQHASCEVSAAGTPYCSRLGAAVDFIVEHEDMREVVQWILKNCEFDRIYFYGKDRPIHVSLGPELSRAIFEMTEQGTRIVPRRFRIAETPTMSKDRPLMSEG